MTSVLKANAEGDIDANPGESSALKPEKTGLLSFWVFPKRMNPEELKHGAFGSPWGREMLYIKKAERVGRFDVVTIAYNRKKIVDDLREELSSAQRDQKDGSAAVSGAWLNLLDNSQPDPEFQMVGIGKVKIDGKDYYVYTGADKGGIKVPKPSQATSAVPSISQQMASIPVAA